MSKERNGGIIRKPPIKSLKKKENILYLVFKDTSIRHIETGLDKSLHFTSK